MQPKFKPWLTELELRSQGKVNDMFNLPDYEDYLLAVKTDRVSTHNVVHESTIPKKGYVLTALTVFWTQVLEKHGINTHVVAHGEDIFKYVPLGITDDPRDLAKRALVIKKLEMIPVEFIFRDRMAGSIWKNFYSKGIQNPYGLLLPDGMRFMEQFPQPIFTPTEKSENDDPILTGDVLEWYYESYSISDRVFRIIREEALKRNIDPVDGKFELGVDAFGRMCLGDEYGTPDTCRFIKKGTIVIGQEPIWLDKQYLREEAEHTWTDGPKAPLTFSPEVIKKSTEIYEKIHFDFTGESI